jgi:hypothetical protein
MAISLSTLRRKERPKPAIMVIFGTGGVGKTTLAAGAPDPVVLAVEDGIGTLDVPHWPIANFADAMQAIGVLYSEEHDRKTLVLDSLDWFEPHVWAEACRKNSWSSIEDAGYGRGYVAATAYWRELIDGLRALRDERGMTVILIAHSTIKRFDSPETEPFDRYLLRLHDRAANLIIEAADVVSFVNYRVSVAKTDSGFNKKISRGVGNGQRVAYFEERPGFISKNRFNFPPSIDLPMSQDPAILWGAISPYLPTATPAAIAA